jgi:hypothetical protein
MSSSLADEFEQALEKAAESNLTINGAPIEL